MNADGRRTGHSQKGRPSIQLDEWETTGANLAWLDATVDDCAWKLPLSGPGPSGYRVDARPDAEPELDYC